nr:uncharacterized mitochondrial protein AtMg00810-like [Tanacetum cinerariifolium]
MFKPNNAWMFNLDYLTNSMNYESVSLENQANKYAGPQKANNSAGTQAIDDQRTHSEEIDLNDDHFVLPIWPAYSTTIKSSEDKIQNTIDCKPIRKEATHETQDVNTNNTNLLNAVSAPVSAVGPSRALNNDEPSYLGDPLMPHLEDIYASPSAWIFTDSSYDAKGVDERGVVVRNKACLVAQGHRQEEGIDYDEVFVPMASIEAIRIFLAFASYTGFIVYQIDVKSAFLYGTIDEEVYVTQPPRFVDPKFPNKVYKVVKALYGLHQASRACVKTASTPTETQKPLVKDKEAVDVDVHLYRSMIGSLMYLTASRSDIMFAVYACFRFQVTPKTSHLQALKRIFRYLKGQPILGLWYPKVSSFNLEAYSDSDYVGVNLDRKYTTGGCQFFGRRLISWQCKKQTIVATSTTKAEYVDAAHCCGKCLSAKTTSLNEFSSTMASTIIGLATTQKFNISSALVLKPPSGMNLAALWHQQSSVLPQTRSLTSQVDHQLGDMSHHQDIYDNPSLTKKVFANMKRVGTSFFWVITPLFENMLVPVAEEVGQAQDDVSIPTEPSTFKPYKKPKSKKQQPIAPKVPSTEPSPKHQLPLPSNDPIPAAKDSLKLQELMDLCTRLSNKVLDLESEVINIKSSFIDKIEKLEDRDKEESFKQGRMIADMDEDVEVNLEEAQAKAYNLDLQHSEKVLNMQDIDEEEPAKVEEVLEVVTVAKLITK